MKLVSEIGSILKALPTLEDAQLELTLLRACFSLPKFAFVLRTSPPSKSHLASLAFDEVIRAALSEILCSPLSDEAWIQATLPVHIGGLGLRSAASHAPAAYFSSVFSTKDLTAQLIEEYVPPSLAEAAATLPISPLREDGSPRTQKEVSWAIDKSLHDSLMARAAHDERSKARLQSLTLPHNGDFLNVVPSKSLGLAIPSPEFRMVTSYRLGIPLYPAEAPCPVCGKQSDEYGDHAVACGGEYERISRHDRLRDCIFGAATTAALCPKKEVMVTSTQSRPADILLPTWTRGQPAALDATVISSLQQATRKGASENSGHALAIAEARKRAAHAANCRDQGVQFIPIAVEVLGGWADEGRAVLRTIARYAAERSQDPPPNATRHLMGKLSIVLQKGNGTMLVRRGPTLQF